MPDLRKFRTLARNWEAFGDDDPMFGVLSDPTKFGGKWDADEFFASGRAHVKKLLRTLADARASFEPGTCLDFGCGVGRLTVPLSESFRQTTGVDVARPMIAAARGHLPSGARCEFVLNRDPHLRRFSANTFDLVHSCLVLQHIPSAYAARYIGEFFRVARPGGLVVFQVPALVWTESEITAAHALPDEAFSAELSVADVPPSMQSGEQATVRVLLCNRGNSVWPHDIPAGRHICAGNHWLLEDGTAVSFDDGRAFLPRPVGPGESVEIPLGILAPAAAGRYVLEVDLVQEHVAWFAQKGSPTARVTIDVIGAAAAPEVVREPVDSGSRAEAGMPRGRRRSFVRRWIRRLRGGTPSFEMHVLPRAQVEQLIRESDGQLLKAVDDNAAGPGWLSYTYICRKLGVRSAR